MTVKNVPAPQQTPAPMSDIDVQGGTTLTKPIAPPTTEQPKGSPDR